MQCLYRPDLSEADPTPPTWPNMRAAKSRAIDNSQLMIEPVLLDDRRTRPSNAPFLLHCAGGVKRHIKRDWVRQIIWFWHAFGATRNPQELGSPMSSARYGRCYQFLLSSAWESLTFDPLPWFLYDSSAGLGLVAPKACQNLGS